MPHLLVIIGSIASGKTTIADGLAERLRKAGRTVAILDLDWVVEAIGGFTGLTLQRFEQAQEVHGQVVGAWLRQGIDVIAHGPFFEPSEMDAVLRHVPEGPRSGSRCSGSATRWRWSE